MPAMKRNIDILFISAFSTTFINDDLEVLERHFNVRRQIGHGLFSVLRIVLGVLNSDIVFSWFASVYGSIGVAVGKFFGLKSAIVVGGLDVAKEKELGYGIWLSPWKSRLVRYALRKADRVLVVDPSLREDAVRLADYDGKNIVYLPTGYDSSFWRPVGEKEPFVLTVANVKTETRLRVKGIDTLIKAAERLLQVKFVVIGVDPALALQLRPPLNMEYYPAMPQQDLLPFYRQAKVYCQPSLREGLSNALCEAMLCQCIPVATAIGGNLTAVGDSGILIPSGDLDALVAAVEHAIEMPAEAGAKGRARIVALFPKEKRQSELVRIIESLVK